MNRVIAAINNAKNIAILSHIKTDCDAVCSSLAFKLGLEGIGKNADVYIDSGFSEQMVTLPYFDKVNNPTCKTYDLYVCLDNADIDRLGKYKYKIMKHRAISVQLDHHGTNTRYCKINYVNEKYAATCELLYDFFGAMNIKINSVMARLMLTGIYTDTGKLSYSNTTANTLFVASRLLKIYGESLDTVCQPIFSSKTYPEFCINKIAYNNAEFFCDNKIGIIVITTENFKSANATIDDTHGLTDILLSVKSIGIAICISQDISQDNCYFVSVRTKGELSARNIAEVFGGGGHFNASGCKIFDTLQNAKQNLLQAAKEELKW